MKKLMMAVAIVCAAVAANAASCTWGFEWAYAIDQSHTTYVDETSMSGTYLIVLGDSVANITADAEGNFKYDTASFTKVAEGTFVDNSAGDIIKGLDVSNNGKYLTMIIFEDDFQNSKGQNMYGLASAQLAGAAEEPSPADFSDVTFANDGAGYFVANIGAENVPEPTSGLLLLIGMAGLALRRRHA